MKRKTGFILTGVGAVVGVGLLYSGRSTATVMTLLPDAADPPDQSTPPDQGGPQPHRGTSTTGLDNGPVGQPPVTPDKPTSPGRVWSRFEHGPAAARTIDLGDVGPGRWKVQLYAVEPKIPGSITFKRKIGKKEYRWNDPPPDGGRVLSASVDVMNKGITVITPAAEVVAQGYGAPAGTATAIAEVLSSIIDAIPELVRRGRVRNWSEFREGERGSAAQKDRMKKMVERWRDANPIYALGQSKLLDYWQWQGSGGELPTLAPSGGGKPIPTNPAYALVGQPRAVMTPLPGSDSGAQRITITIPATEQTPSGERRIVAVATPA